MRHHTTPHQQTFRLLNLAIVVAVLCAGGIYSSVRAVAQQPQHKPQPTLAKAPKATAVADAPEAKDSPLFHEYKGVKLGMSAEEARQKLGEPANKSDEQDFYAFSENETAQLFYDKSQKVSALSITYIGEGSAVPTCETVIGAPIEARADGSKYLMKEYPKAGFWVSYSRTAGDSPIVTVTIKKR